MRITYMHVGEMSVHMQHLTSVHGTYTMCMLSSNARTHARTRTHNNTHKHRQIVPRGEDIRMAGPRAGRGRPLSSPNAYGVPVAEASLKRRRKRPADPTSPNPTRRQLRLVDTSPSNSTRSRTALSRRPDFPSIG
jgi:hypothetical protein